MTRFCTCAAAASPVDLSRKRKQVAEITCKTCGRQLVDAVRRSPATMLSTVGLELTNFINTGLTWKTVTKGVRSASRRGRKPAKSLNGGVPLEDKSMKSEDSSVSESEKLGVAVLGRHFGDKVEHVPLKKRRLMLRSPSPPPRTPSPLNKKALSSQPQTPSPQTEVSDKTIDSKYASGRRRCSNSVSKREKGESNRPVKVQAGQGIEKGFVNGKLSEVNGKFGFEDFSGIALLAAIACGNSISDDAHNVKEVPIVEEFPTPEGIDSSLSAPALEKTASSSSEMGSSLRKDSADEDNINGLSVQDYSVSVSQDVHCERDCGEKKPSSMKDARLHWDLNTLEEEWEVPLDDAGIPDDSMHCEKSDRSEDGAIRRGREHALGQLKYSTPETEVSTQIVRKVTFPDNSLTSASDHISSRPVSNDKINTPASDDKAVSIGNVHLEKHDLILQDLTVSEDVMHEIDSTCTKEDETLCLPDNGIFPTEMVSTVTCQMSDADADYSVSKSGKASPSCPSSEHVNFSELGTTCGGGRVLVVDMEENQDKEDPATDPFPMDSSSNVEPKVPMSKSYGYSSNIALENPSEDGYGSGISYGGQKIPKTQAGYESPFEDGELRESLEISWEENDIDGETECVDYDSDNRDQDDFDNANCCISDGCSGSSQNVNNGPLAGKVVKHGGETVLKESSHLASPEKSFSQDELPEGGESSINGTDEANTLKILASDSMDGLVKGSLVGEVGSALHKKDTVFIPRSRSSYDSSFRAVGFGSEKSMGRDRPTPRMQDDSSSGYWHSRNQYPSGYNDPHDTVHPRARREISDSDVKVDGLTHHDQRRSVNYSSMGVYRPFIRRRSPAEFEDSYSEERDNSHFRSRGRYGINRPGGFRGSREEYRGPVSDDPPLSSVRQPHYLSRRERSFSPVANRGASFSRPHRNSQSRSRSRSPVTWHLPKERNMGMRRLSRSPDFRSEARMERRIPFRKQQNFEVEDRDDLVSPPRSRFSPLRYSRWTHDRNFVSARFKERESPGRLFARNQRFESPQRENQFEPIIRPRRFTNPYGGSARGHRYDGSDSARTRNGDRYETIHRVRGPRYDAEDSFEARNAHNDDSFIRGSGRRDVPRGAGGHRGSFRYNRDRKIYDSGPKLSGIRDYDDEDASPGRE